MENGEKLNAGVVLTVEVDGQKVDLPIEHTMVVIVQDNPDMDCIVMSNTETGENRTIKRGQVSEEEFTELASLLEDNNFHTQKLSTATPGYFALLDQMNVNVADSVVLNLGESGQKWVLNAQNTHVTRYADSPEKDFIMHSPQDDILYMTRDDISDFDQLVFLLESANVPVSKADQPSPEDERMLEYVAQKRLSELHARQFEELVAMLSPKEWDDTLLAEYQEIFMANDEVDDALEDLLLGLVGPDGQTSISLGQLRYELAKNSFNLSKKLLSTGVDDDELAEIFSNIIYDSYAVRRGRISGLLAAEGIGYADIDRLTIADALRQNIETLRYQADGKSENDLCQYMAEEIASKVDSPIIAVHRALDARRKKDFEVASMEGQSQALEELAKANENIERLKHQLEAVIADNKTLKEAAVAQTYILESVLSEMRALRKDLESDR